jgi:hypothetical protein
VRGRSLWVQFVGNSDAVNKATHAFATPVQARSVRALLRACNACRATIERMQRACAATSRSGSLNGTRAPAAACGSPLSALPKAKARSARRPRQRRLQRSPVQMLLY